jgi:hypothetical protein
MQTTCRPNPPAAHRQPSLYPERRMTFETGKRRPETGGRKQETRKLGKGRLRLCARRSPVSDLRSPDCIVSGFRSPLSGFVPSPGFLASSFARQISGLPLRSVRGRMGDRVYKTYGDKIVVTRVPCFDGHVPTAAQWQRRAMMRAATAYAQAVYADPVAKAIYAAAAKQLGRQPFRLAVADYLRGRPRVKLDPPPKSPANASERKPAAETRRIPGPSQLRFLLQHRRPRLGAIPRGGALWLRSIRRFYATAGNVCMGGPMGSVRYWLALLADCRKRIAGARTSVIRQPVTQRPLEIAHLDCFATA